jgi:hypothetical protein
MAGFIAMSFVVIVCTIVCVHAMHLQSGHPTPAYLGVNVAYSLAAAALGGYVAARIAGYRPLLHSGLLGAIMFCFGALQLRHPAPAQPYAYQVFLAIAPPLAAWAGGLLVRKPRA